MKAKLPTHPRSLLVAPASGVHSRRMPGVLVIDGKRRIRSANGASLSMLRPVAGTEMQFACGCQLPAPFTGLLDEIESRLAMRHDSCTVMLPGYDLCIRACLIESEDESNLLLLIERASRQDVVRSALANHPLLTPREGEVAELVLRGYSNRRIADHLVLTEYTVEDHLKRIFAKLGVRSRSALSSKILGIREEATG